MTAKEYWDQEFGTSTEKGERVPPITAIKFAEEYTQHNARIRYQKAVEYYTETHFFNSKRLDEAFRIAAGITKNIET